MMKFLFPIVLLTLAFSSVKVTAQTSMSFGYIAPFGVEPGLNLASNIYARQTTKPIVTDLPILSKYINKGFWQPQVAFFTRPKYNSNLLLSMGRGIKRNKRGSKSYSTASLGVGYLAQFEIVTTTVQLGSADIEKERERRDYFLPSISYTFGRNVKPYWGWYIKGMYGKQFSSKYESAGLFMLGLGFQFIPAKTAIVNEKW